MHFASVKPGFATWATVLSIANSMPLHRQLNANPLSNHCNFIATAWQTLQRKQAIKA
jgi:hypothetical protein